MDAAAVTRFARQLALPQVGPAGQERFARARVAVVGRGLAAEVVARYLAGAGVGTLRLLGGAAEDAWDEALRGSNPAVALEHAARPSQGHGWLDALAGADLVVREGFDDDSMLNACVRLGVPAITLRVDAETGAADVLSFRKHGPCPHAPLDVPALAAVAAPDGPASVVAGAVAAGEALQVLLGAGLSGPEARARHLRLPLDGHDATAQEVPWTPECFACGGSGSEMSFQ
jgi:molybdopterin/thiamine biosynthesis adenylyltransferase